MPNNSSNSLNKLKDEIWNIELQIAPNSWNNNNKSYYKSTFLKKSRDELIKMRDELKRKRDNPKGFNSSGFTKKNHNFTPVNNTNMNNLASLASNLRLNGRNLSITENIKNVILVFAHGSSIPSRNEQGRKLKNTFVLPEGVSYTTLTTVNEVCPLTNHLDKDFIRFLRKNSIFQHYYKSNTITEEFKQFIGSIKKTYKSQYSSVHNLNPKNHYMEGQICNDIFLDFSDTNQCGFINIFDLKTNTLPTHLRDMFKQFHPELKSFNLSDILTSFRGKNTHFIINACRSGLNEENRLVARTLSNNPEFNNTGGGSRSRKNKKSKTKTSRKPKTKTSRLLRTKKI